MALWRWRYGATIACRCGACRKLLAEQTVTRAMPRQVEQIMLSQGVTGVNGQGPYSVVKVGDGGAAAGAGCC